MLVDAHVHLFRAGFHGRYGRASSGGDDLQIYDSFRAVHLIESALAIGFQGDNRYRDNNRYLAQVAARHDWIRRVAYVSPWPPPTSTELDQLALQGFCGLALWLTSPAAAQQFAAWPKRTLARVAMRCSVVSLNAGPPALAVCRQIVDDLAPATVLLSHLGLPGRIDANQSAAELLDLARPILDLAHAENVEIKLSGLYGASEPRHAYPHHAARPWIDLLFDRFGAQRLVWGSDYPVCLDWVSFAQAVDVPLPPGLSETERFDVMGRNLMRILDRPELLTSP